MAFGEAGLPAHPALRLALAEATGRTGYGPVAGQAGLREAAAGYWQRRGLDTDPAGDRLRAGQQGAAVRADAGHRRGRGRAPAELGQLRRAGQPDRGAAALRGRSGPARAACPTPIGSATRSGPPAAAGRPRCARSSSRCRTTRPARWPARPAIRALCRVADEHDLIIISDEIYRDLVHAGDRAVHQPGRHRPGPDGRDHRAEQEPGPGRLADRGGPAARRRAGPAAAPAAAGPAGRHRQRDLVRAGRADPAGRRVRVQRAARAGRADRAQPAAARGRWPRRWRGRFTAAGA